MKIVTAFFDRDGGYTKLLRVMRESIKKHMPKTELKVLRVDVPEGDTCHDFDTYYGFIPAAVYAFNSKENLAIADCDLMFTGEIESAFDYDFDLAFTVRDNPKYNTGLWFCRPTKRAKEFIRQWIHKTNMIVDHYYDLKHVINSNYGIDQASLAMTIELNEDIKIKELPCRIWNAEQTNWRGIDEKTKVVHIKSGLKTLLLNNWPLKKKHLFLKPIIQQWRWYYENSRIGH